ncbi:alanine--tRNA ligase [Salinisphaera sp. USBA-960]|nr:alanine--tRNA ligase [Salifodinibacter halophilus]NNC25712.1 alanine--tRNA ligase [Salifodinibacter halophilus]
MTTNALRACFIEFFERYDHRFVASSSLVPASDPTLLFTNAGMVPFKETFLGREPRDYVRAVTSQRCVRAGGKHNDLENVGYTARHHTFFEMLGNFSFGDYFKREAIQRSWQFLTDELGLPPERLFVTVYEQDEEAADIWLSEIGIDSERFARIGAADNFWQMGDTGPCGPCSEIFYDHGPDVPGGPPGSPDEDGDRFVEVWNLVFMQYDRSEDGTLAALPSPSIDTGMGLERMAAVMQGTPDNYATDVFQHLISAGAGALGVTVDADNEASLKVIADHIRATAFLITDGVMPSKEGRGNVLRRIMRRALRHGYSLGTEEPFFYRLVPTLVELMGDAFPELARSQAQIESVVHQEEQRFAATLANGMRLLENAISAMDGTEIPGETVFKLYDTYGFPVDLTNDIARERGLSLDMAGFESQMTAQRERARAASQFNADAPTEVGDLTATDFLGYEQDQTRTQVIATLVDDEYVDALTPGQRGVVVLDATPFYGEAGGQVGDTGVIETADARFVVVDTQKRDGVYMHIGDVESGQFGVGDDVTATIDAERRRAIEQNHTATHLLHAALREILGTHVQQKGSLVAPDRLRFDFAHYAPVGQDEAARIEARVNEQIRANIPGEFEIMSYDAAIAQGALAFFDEKYGDTVRVVRFSDYSVELCGGTHVAASGTLGLATIADQRGVAAGVRRIEVVTGAEALAEQQRLAARQNRIAARLKATPDEIETKLDQTLAHNAELGAQLDAAKQKLAAGTSAELAADAQSIGDINLVAQHLEGADRQRLRETVDTLKQRLDNAVVVLGSASEGKVALTAGVADPERAGVAAGDLVNFVASQVGGKGGGRPDMAQAGGNQPEKLDDALAAVTAWIETNAVEA